jgi:hypothetical protein
VRIFFDGTFSGLGEFGVSLEMELWSFLFLMIAVEAAANCEGELSWHRKSRKSIVGGGCSYNNYYNSSRSSSRSRR